MRRASGRWSVLCASNALLRTTAVAIGALLAASAAAEVQLTNSVQKVETYVDAAGVMQRRLVDADTVLPGDELRYTITFVNVGTTMVDAGSIIITNPLPENTEYLEGSAAGPDTVILFSVDGEEFAPDRSLTMMEGGRSVAAAASDYRAIRWTFSGALAPGASSFVTFDVRLR